MFEFEASAGVVRPGVLSRDPVVASSCGIRRELGVIGCNAICHLGRGVELLSVARIQMHQPQTTGHLQRRCFLMVHSPTCAILVASAFLLQPHSILVLSWRRETLGALARLLQMLQLVTSALSTISARQTRQVIPFSTVATPTSRTSELADTFTGPVLPNWGRARLQTLSHFSNPQTRVTLTKHCTETQATRRQLAEGKSHAADFLGVRDR